MSYETAIVRFRFLLDKPKHAGLKFSRAYLKRFKLMHALELRLNTDDDREVNPASQFGYVTGARNGRHMQLFEVCLLRLRGEQAVRE